MNAETKSVSNTSRKGLFIWVSLLLLPVAILIPLIGGEIQHEAIGNEHLCCASFLNPEAVARAEHAKSLHWLSNIIVGGSIILALALTIAIVVLIYRRGILKQWSKRIQMAAKIVLAIIAILPLFLLITAMIYFVINNKGYYIFVSQPPGDQGIYAYVLDEVYDFFDSANSF